jgi:hypothetical protein
MASAVRSSDHEDGKTSESSFPMKLCWSILDATLEAGMIDRTKLVSGIANDLKDLILIPEVSLSELPFLFVRLFSRRDPSGSSSREIESQLESRAYFVRISVWPNFFRL